VCTNKSVRDLADKDRAHGTAAAIPQNLSIPAGVLRETVTEFQHYTDSLFRFRITRDSILSISGPASLLMIGLPNAEKNGVELFYRVAIMGRGVEFLLYKVILNGPLTQHLQKLQGRRHRV